MKHDQLLALEAIVATGTFRGAAGRLHKSQSAVSHAIRLLEAELEISLFNRESYRPVLTAEGEVFHREAARVLRQMRDLGATAARLRAREEAELRLAITATLPLDPLLAVLAELDRKYPATQLRLATEMMGGPIARLLEGKADLAIAALDGVPLAEVETRPVAEITIRPLAAPALAETLPPGLIPMAEIQGHAQVVVAGTGGPGHEQSRDLLPGGRKWTVSDFAAKKQVMLAGLGWGGLPDHLTVAERKAGHLVPLDVEGYPPRHAVLFAIRRRDSPPGLVGRELWERL